MSEEFRRRGDLDRPWQRVYLSAKQYLLDNHVKEAGSRDTECWVWTGSVISWGYGQASFDGRQGYAHRLAAALERCIARSKGPPPVAALPPPQHSADELKGNFPMRRRNLR